MKLKRSFILALILSLSACAHGPVPDWNGTVYIGAPARDGVEQTKKNLFISAQDPNFRHGYYMTREDFTSFVMTYVEGCRTWKKGTKMMSSNEALDRFHYIYEDWKAEAEATKK